MRTPPRPNTVAGRAAVLLALLMTAAGCSTGPRVPTPTAAPVSGWPRSITDDTGVVTVLPAPPKRIVSLAPSNTEILFALGAGDRLVADTQSCDYPPEARNRPHVGGMSAGDLERIQTSLPDLVVAVGSLNRKLIDALRAARIPTIAIEPRRTADIFAGIRLIGKATGREAQADGLAAGMQKRIDRIRTIAAQAPSRPKTLIVYSDHPIYTSPPDSYIHDLIGVAGGEDVVRTPLPQNIISPAVVIERAPDVIICAASLQPRLKAMPGWGAVPAVRDNRFFSTSSGAPLARPGPRVVDAAEELARFLHPDLFPVASGLGPR
ncbi:MAG TPA: ABC transporter substrate-binding protein [Chthonomonadaceae bacterium]|nr:ABC transporter substrate-binding protein [Chthonomonadaceae bacterium]